jgi:hypothetical protein
MIVKRAMKPNRTQFLFIEAIHVITPPFPCQFGLGVGPATSFLLFLFPKARDVWGEVRMSDERAGFREAESEERIEQDFLAGEIAA